MNKSDVISNVHAKIKEFVDELDGDGLIVTDMDMVSEALLTNESAEVMVDLVLFGYDPELKLDKTSKLLKRAADELQEGTQDSSVDDDTNNSLAMEIYNFLGVE